jgi:hypothetical protein
LEVAQPARQSIDVGKNQPTLAICIAANMFVYDSINHIDVKSTDKSANDRVIDCAAPPGGPRPQKFSFVESKRCFGDGSKTAIA